MFTHKRVDLPMVSVLPMVYQCLSAGLNIDWLVVSQYIDWLVVGLDVRD